MAQEEAAAAAAEAARAKVEEKKRAREEKKRRDESRIKGSGVWSRYEYITEEELRRREEAKWAVTSGTRRGRQFKVDKVDAKDGTDAALEPGIEVDEEADGKSNAHSPTARADPIHPAVNGTHHRVQHDVETRNGSGSQRHPEDNGSLEKQIPLLTNGTSKRSHSPAPSAPSKRPRGRPRGSGKHQIAAAEAQRRLSEASQAGPSIASKDTEEIEDEIVVQPVSAE